MNPPRVTCLRNHFPWMGGHSGYDRLADALALAEPEAQVTLVERRAGLPTWLERRRLRNRFWAARSSELYTWASADGEARLVRSLQSGCDLAHTFYLEQDYGLLSRHGTRRGAKVVATAHQPPSWWRLQHERHDLLTSLDGIVAVSRELAAFLAQRTKAQVRFIPHGIDTVFFCPPRQRPQGPPRLLLTGQWLRDFDCLAQVLDRLLPRLPRVQMDLLVPRWRRAEPVMLRIARHPQVHWHCNLSDDALRGLYQHAHALLMPLLDCTANNAVLEAMACGLPIVASDLPAIADYTDDVFCTRTPPGDAKAMATALEAVLALDAGSLESRRAAARNAALKLDWWKIAVQVWQFYREVAPE